MKKGFLFRFSLFAFRFSLFAFIKQNAAFRCVTELPVIMEKKIETPPYGEGFSFEE
jgi:hypothetical protein